MKAHKFFGSSRLILIVLLLLGGLTVSAVTYADSILPSFGIVSEGSFFSGFSRSGPTTTQIGGGASVTVDREEYAPGQIVEISGSGFAPNEQVTLLVEHVSTAFALKASAEAVTSFDHEGHTAWQIAAEPDGTFSSSWLVGTDCYGATLRLTADQGGLHAETTFRDAIGFNKGVYNKDDFPPDSTGKWTSGNAGSHYEEGQWVDYEYQVAGISGSESTPDFDIKFNHYQQNVNAIFIDAFANFRACVDCTEDSDVTQGGNDGIAVGMLLHDVPYPSTDVTNWKSAIGAISFINGTLNGSGQCVATEDLVNAPSEEHCFKVDGSALQGLFPATDFSSGIHTITLFYEAHLSNTRTWKNGKQHLIGCPTSIHYAAPGPEVVPADTVYGTEAYNGGDPCAQDNAGDWTGSFQGVGFATGSSRHFNIINQTAGSSGALSLPIPTVEAPTGSITIIKVTRPSPAVGLFGFNGDLGPFDLDTDPNTATSNTITFPDIPGNIPFSVNEASMPNDWSLDTLVCSVSTGGSVATNIATATATVTLPSTAGASATCTFTNKNDNLLNGRIIVVKQTTPDGDPQEFTFTPSYNGGTPFDLSDGESNDSCEGGANCLPQDTYSVAETVPADWTLTSATCSDGSPVNAIVLGEGETVTCTFNNTKLTADIEVTKESNLDEVCIGADTQVTYTYRVSNPGTAALPTVTVSDNNGTAGDTSDDFSPTLQSGDDGDNVLQPGEVWVYTAVRTINATTTNIVTATGTTAGGQQDSDTASATVTAYVCTITVTKTPSVDEVCIGGSVNYTYTVKNNSTAGGFIWTGNLVDDMGTAGTGDDVTVATGITLNPQETEQFAQNGVALSATTTNVATASGNFDDASSTPASDTDDATVTVYNCTITVNKTARQTEICIGGSVTFDITVKNNSTFFTWTGNLVDDNGTPANTADDIVVDDSISLAPGETAAYVTSATLNTDTTNTATATGTFGDVNTTAAAHSDYEFIDTHPCTVAVTKSADADVICSGKSTTYDFSITNESDQFTWTGTLVDDKVGDIGGGQFSLAPNETKTFDNVAGPILTQNTTNTVTGDGTFDDPATSSASDTASDTVNVTNCTISVTKTPSATNVCNGATVTYDYSITNNSDTFTWTGTFVDNVIGDVGGGAVVLAPNTTSNFNDVPWVIKGTVNNTVEGSGTFDDGSSSSASASASATVIGNICRIILQKVTLPAGGGPFDFDGEFNQNLSDGDSVTHDKTSPDSYETTENVPAGWDLTNRVCVDPNNNSTNTSADVAGGGTGSVTFNLQLGETITCTFTNTERGTVSITKTFEGGPIPAGESFDFQLRQGASTVSDGTVLDSVTVDSTTLFPLQLNGSLIPGEYQVCEYIQVGWDSTIRTMLGAFVPNSLSDPANTDNSFVCAPITIDPGEDETVVIDNTPPPGGMAKTIGFWKNHSSCKASNGGQEPVLDQTLALFPIAFGQTTRGFYIGLRYIDTCAEAYALLNKSLIEGTGGKGKGGTKTASDPAFNMAAQLVAVKLNLQAGAGAPNCLGSIVAEADALLGLVGFNGDAIPSYGNGATGSARKARMNYLAGLLDAYNNNNLNCASYVP